ncbi:hypothetical protein B0H13DRAFT_1873630 [Mycena leptocephala]|nr:hypothetical protein B0H13DRAFT_1873630 [Mycena leptocephala]
MVNMRSALFLCGPRLKTATKASPTVPAPLRPGRRYRKTRRKRTCPVSVGLSAQFGKQSANKQELSASIPDGGHDRDSSQTPHKIRALAGYLITPMTKALQVQPDPHKFSEGSRFGRSREQDICYVIALVAALPKEGRKIFVTSAVYLVTGHKIAPVGQARRTGIPIAKALRAGIFATSDEYTQREPTGVNDYDEPMPQAGFDPDPSTLRCPICFDTVCRPVVTLCLHVFCDECIYKSLRDSSLACPLCRASIPQPPEPDAILEGYLERAVAEGIVAVPSGGRSSPYTWRDVEFSRSYRFEEVRKRRHKMFLKKTELLQYWEYSESLHPPEGGPQIPAGLYRIWNRNLVLLCGWHERNSNVGS